MAEGVIPRSNIAVTSVQPYRYISLATARTIRVLELLPDVAFEAPLRCNLVQLEIEDTAEPGIEYEAISYCWGEPIFSHVLLCDGNPLKIHPNVDSLLRYLRRDDRVQRFWIDGICINQQDPVEKSIQISIMGDIYFCAKRVHAWLGDTEASDVEAFKGINKLACLGPSGQKLNFEDIDQVLRTHEGQSASSIAALLARPWFTRRWILQEVGLSHETWLHCGPLSTNISFLMSALQVLSRRVDHDSWVVNESLQSLVSLAMGVCGCKPQEKSVLELLMQYKASKCLDERDKIHSLLALGNDELTRSATTQEILGMPKFIPSYTVPVSEIYQNFAMCCIIGRYYTQVLCMAVCFPRQGAPSWVPDFNLSDPSQAFEQTRGLMHGDLLPSEWVRSSLVTPFPSYEEDHALALSREELCTVPATDGEGFWLLPKAGHKVSRIDLVGKCLPKDASRETIVDVLRSWLSLFTVENAYGNPPPTRFPSRYAPAAGYWVQPYKCAEHREMDIAPVNVEEKSSRKFWRLHSSPAKNAPLVKRNCTRCKSTSGPDEYLNETSDDYYIEADVFGLDTEGFVPLTGLLVVLEMLTSHSSHKRDLPRAKPNHNDLVAKWFGIECPNRRGFVRLLTSDAAPKGLLTARDWRHWLTQDQFDAQSLCENGGSDVASLDGHVNDLCTHLLEFAGGRALGSFFDHQSMYRLKRTHQVYYHSAILCPADTTVGDVCLTLEIRTTLAKSEKESHQLSSLSGGNAPPSKLAAFILTPSFRWSHPHSADKSGHAIELDIQPAKGYRILGDGFISNPFKPSGLFAKNILINA